MNPAKTLKERVELCERLARAIVSSYRAECPEGFDPQNSGVALATLVVGAGTAAWQANQQKKAAEQASGAIPNPGRFPEYIPLNLDELQNTAVNYDTRAYGLSDANFKRRHRPLLKAEKLFERQVLADQKGESELMPALQNEFMRAGIGGALDAFGDTPGTLAPGSAGEASVARNLGINIMGFQDRNRENRQRSLLIAEELFPRRQFGLTGADAVNVMAANNAGENNANQAAYANSLGLTNTMTAQGNIMAEASARRAAESQKAIISAAELAAQLAAANSATRQPASASSLASTGGVPANTGSWKSSARGY